LASEGLTGKPERVVEDFGKSQDEIEKLQKGRVEKRLMGKATIQRSPSQTRTIASGPEGDTEKRAQGARKGSCFMVPG